MSPVEIQQLKALIVATSLYYGQKIPDEVLGLYVEDLVDLPFAEVALAIKEARRDPKTTRFPLPAVLRVRVNPETDPETEAVEAVGRIVQAVTRIGPYDSSRARRVIGDLAWRVVELEGGWETVCEVLTYDNMGQLKAQWRNLAKAQYTRARAGLSAAPALPSPEAREIATMTQLLAEMPR